MFKKTITHVSTSFSVTESILNVIKALAPHWRSLNYQCELEEGELCPFDGVNEDPPKQVYLL